MANFIVIVDPERERRSRFLQKIEPLLPPVEGLVTNRCGSGDFSAIWAANPTAPISYDSDAEGAAVIWGDAIAPDDSERTDAKSLRKLWQGSSSENFPSFDGFYAAAVYRADRSLVVGADLIGTFPVYYYTSDDITLVGSSPELFEHHPNFKKTFNPAGLVGILLTNGLFDGQTLWSDVRRLEAGNLLLWQPGNAPQEINQYPTLAQTQSESYTHLTFADQVDLLAQVLDRAIARHTSSNQRHSLLLSGGLDSRMLAGFLRRQEVDTVTATLGVRTDLEMECAIPVARALGFEHRTVPVPLAQYPLCADKLVRWEHLANGCNVLMSWATSADVGSLAPKVMAGYAIDLAVGGKGAYYLYPKALSFDTYFADFNEWGFSPSQLESLLRKDVFGDLVRETLARIRAVYEGYSALANRRAWCFELYHRQRFHTCSSGWRLSFGAWPILPILDRKLLETAIALPVSTIAKRRAQSELVQTQFPQLAQLPLDRNSYNTQPLQPSKTRQTLEPLFGVQRKWRKLQQKLGWERRYYYRVFDINNAGWKAVRQQAEPYRQKVRHLFVDNALDRVLPPPNVRVGYHKDSIIESSRIKALLGFLLWSQEHL